MADAAAAKSNPGKRCDSSGMSICDNNGSDASSGAVDGTASATAAATAVSISPSAASPNTATSSGYTSLNNHPHGEF